MSLFRQGLRFHTRGMTPGQRMMFFDQLERRGIIRPPIGGLPPTIKGAKVRRRGRGKKKVGRPRKIGRPKGSTKVKRRVGRPRKVGRPKKR